MDLQLDGAVAALCLTPAGLAPHLIHRLGREGASMGLFGSDPDHLKSLLESAAGPAIAVEGRPDLPTDQETFLADVREAYGQVDLLLVETPISNDTGFGETSASGLDDSLRTVMNGPLCLTQTFLPALQQSDHARVLFLAYRTPDRPDKPIGGLGSEGLIASVPSIAHQLESYNIPVNALQIEMEPGGIRDPEDAHPAIRDPDSAANAALMLCSPLLRGVNGSVLTVGGGKEG